MKVVFFFIFVMLCVQAAAAQTIITIGVQENGNASWIVEKHLPLNTQSEINEWEIILKDNGMYRYRKDITEFSDTINESLRSAENYSNRSMKAENFNISYGVEKIPPSAYGIMRFNFDWENFSRNGSSGIIIGDAFSGQMALSSDNVLIIKIPDGYDVVNVSPGFDKRDGNRLIWDGTLYRTLNKGEPSLVLSQLTVSQEPSNTMAIAIILFISGGLLVFWKRRRSVNRIGNAVSTYESGNVSSRKDDIEFDATNTLGGSQANSESKDVQIDVTGADTAIKENNMTDEPRADITGTDAVQTGNAGTAQANITDQILNPDMPLEFLGDEEMIGQYLIKRGGQAYQSDIVKDSGLSKSKISIVLAKMKEDGLILKIRKGKENIIRLAVKK